MSLDTFPPSNQSETSIYLDLCIRRVIYQITSQNLENVFNFNVLFKKIVFLLMWTIILKVFNLLKISFLLFTLCGFFLFFFFGHEASGILTSQPGIKPIASAVEGEVLAPGPPAESLVCHLSMVTWRGAGKKQPGLPRAGRSRLNLLCVSQHPSLTFPTCRGPGERRLSLIL